VIGRRQSREYSVHVCRWCNVRDANDRSSL